MADVPDKKVVGGSSKFLAITPHDSNALARVPRALFIGTGGNLSLVESDDPTATPVLFKNIPNGYTLNVQPSIVRTTNTTAADIVALY